MVRDQPVLEQGAGGDARGKDGAFALSPRRWFRSKDAAAVAAAVAAAAAAAAASALAAKKLTLSRAPSRIGERDIGKGGEQGTSFAQSCHKLIKDMYVSKKKK